MKNHQLREDQLWFLLALADNELALAQASLPPRKPRILTSAIKKLRLQLEALQ